MKSAAALAAAALAALALALNVIAAIDRLGTPLWDHMPRRFWEDVHLAEGLFAFGEFPVSVNGVVRWRDENGTAYFREEHPHFSRMTAEEPVRPWHFWKTVRAGRFLRSDWRRLVDRYDDSGRPLLTALGYRLVGGVAPMMMFWVGPLLAMFVLSWTAWEFARAGWVVTGVVFVLLVGAWPFLADVLVLPYGSAGFHVLGIVGAVPLLAYAALSPEPRSRPILVRSALTGVVIGACLLARGGVLLALTPLAVALAVGTRRASAGARHRWPGLLAAAGLLATLPYATARLAIDRLVASTAKEYGRTSPSPQRHALWFGMWTGLGDFDREKGYRWLDADASAAGVAAGGTPLRSDGYDPSNEAIFRRLILGDIVRDPAWYARILGRRFFATVTQRKLWPWPPMGGRSMAPPGHPNEGLIDSYYALATPADRFGWKDAVVELPVPLLAGPALVVVVTALRRRRPETARQAALVVLALAAGVLPLPVLITTGGAVETQAFVLVYFAGAALLAQRIADDAVRRLWRRAEVISTRAERPVTGPGLTVPAPPL